MKIVKVEITAGISGVIPTRSFENLRPDFRATITIECNGFTNKQISETQEKLYKEQYSKFEQIREVKRAEEIRELFKNFRILKGPGNRMYPSVTTVISWDKDFHITPEQLREYGVRGTVVHQLVENCIKTGSWDLNIIHNKDKIMLKNGSLKLWDTLGKVSFLGFLAKHGNNMKFSEGEFRVFNREFLYTGQPDNIGIIEGEKTIFDFKTRECQDDDFIQMAAYAKCDDERLKGIKQMCLIPLNPKNKCGYGAPVVKYNIDEYFAKFLRYRDDFKERFNI